MSAGCYDTVFQPRATGSRQISITTWRYDSIGAAAATNAGREGLSVDFAVKVGREKIRDRLKIACLGSLS